MLEFILQVVARFVGVSVLALCTVIGSGFRSAYPAEWRRLFDKHSDLYSWVDLFGLLVLVSVATIIALLVSAG